MTTIVLGAEEQVDAGALYRQVLPTVQELEGFRGMLFLCGETDRTFVALTLWRTAASLDAAEPVLESVKRAETLHRRVEAKETARYAVIGSLLAT